MAALVLARTPISAGNSGSSLTIATAASSFNCAIGDYILLQVTAGSSGSSINSVVDSGLTNVYSALGTVVNNSSPTASRLFECVATAAVTSGTITGSYAPSSLSFRSIRVSTWTGTSGLLAQAQQRNGATGSSLTSNNATPTLQPNGVIGFGYIGGSGLSCAAGAGYTNDGAFTTADTALSTFSRLEHKDTTSLAAVAATFTAGASDLYVAHVAVVGEPSGGATRPVKMAGEWGGFAGESGGFVGKPLEDGIYSPRYGVYIPPQVIQLLMRP